jgi:hypothetical protein
MILEAYYVLAAFAMFFTFMTFFIPGNILFSLSGMLLYGMLSISSGAIELVLCDSSKIFSESGFVYVWALMSLVMLIISFMTWQKNAEEVATE